MLRSAAPSALGAKAFAATRFEFSGLGSGLWVSASRGGSDDVALDFLSHEFECSFNVLAFFGRCLQELKIVAIGETLSDKK